MIRIYTAIDIRRPIEQVFNYVTTPGHWPRWHPASRGVSGATDHSLHDGEQVTEDYVVAGRRGRAVWTVRERRAPRRWVIEGLSEEGARAVITYTLTTRSDGTAFERELCYALTNPVHRFLDWLRGRKHVRGESAEALRRLKSVLEADGAAEAKRSS